MKIKTFTAAMLLSASLCLFLFGCAGSDGKTLTMEIPKAMAQQTEVMTMDDDTWKQDGTDTQGFVPPEARAVLLSDEKKAMLYALVSTQANETNAVTGFMDDALYDEDKKELTSVNEIAVLNSSITVLGEAGRITDLAEAELYHWSDAVEFTAVSYTNPIMVSETRCIVRLMLTNDKVGMEQYIIYTDLGDENARIDRVWRTFSIENPVGESELFRDTVQYLASDATV